MDEQLFNALNAVEKPAHNAELEQWDSYFSELGLVSQYDVDVFINTLHFQNWCNQQNPVLFQAVVDRLATWNAGNHH